MAQISLVYYHDCPKQPKNKLMPGSMLKNRMSFTSASATSRIATP